MSSFNYQLKCPQVTQMQAFALNNILLLIPTDSLEKTRRFIIMPRDVAVMVSIARKFLQGWPNTHQ